MHTTDTSRPIINILRHSQSTNAQTSLVLFDIDWLYPMNVELASPDFLIPTKVMHKILKQEGLAVASIARDDPSTLPGDDPFPRACMQRDHNAR